MMKWWLELYTIPLLKLIGKSYLLILVICLLSWWLLPALLLFACMSVFYIAYVVRQNHKNFFATNLEFHKTHVPLKELRKAYIQDALILFSVQIFCYLSIFCIIISQKEMIGMELVAAYILMSFIMSSYPFYALLGLSRGVKPRYSMLDDSYKIFGWFFRIGLFVAGLILVFVLFSAGFSLWTTGTLFFLAMILSHVYFSFRAVFHLEKRHGTPALLLKYVSVGIFSSFLICTLFAIGSRPIVHMTSVNPDMRNVIFSFSGPWAPELDIADAKDLLTSYDADYELIFTKTPEVHLIPLAELMPQANSQHYYKYVRSLTPSTDNMIYILEQLDKKEKHNGHDYRTAQEIVKKWPKQQKFPKHLIGRFLSKEDKAKAQRMPAAQ